MSSAKRTASAATATPDTEQAKEIQRDRKVLQYKVRSAIVRGNVLKERVEEMSQRNEAQARELESHRIYTKRLDERWAALEDALRAIAGTLPMPIPPPPAPAPSTSEIVDSPAAVAAPPVLRFFAQRWSELTHRPAEQMQPPAAPVEKDDDESMEDANGAAVDADAEDEDEKPLKSLKLEGAFADLLEKRSAFTQQLLEQIVGNLPATPASSSSDASALQAEVNALQAERLKLQSRVTSLHSEVIFYSAEVAKRDAELEEDREKGKMLLRRAERLQYDLQSSGGSRSAAAPAGASVKQEAAGSSTMIDVNSVPDTRPLSPLHISDPALVSASTHNDLEWQRQEKDLLEFKALANERQKVVTELHAENSKLKMDLAKAKHTVADIDLNTAKSIPQIAALIRHTDVIKRQCKESEAQRASLQSQLADQVRLTAQLQENFQQQLAEDRRIFTEQIHALQDQLAQAVKLHQNLQRELDEQAAANAAHSDNAFLLKLRAQLPELEATVKSFKLENARLREDAQKAKELRDASKPESHSLSFLEVAKLVRQFREKERLLQAEVDTLRGGPARPSPDPFSLRAQLVAAQKELETFKQLPSDVASLQEQLLAAQELQETYLTSTTEFEDMAASSEERAQKQTEQVLELTKLNEQMKNERVKEKAALRAVRNETQALRAKMEAADAATNALRTADKEARTLIESLRRESQAQKDFIRTHERDIANMKAELSKKEHDIVDVQTALKQLHADQAGCQKAIEEMEKRKTQVDLQVRKLQEQCLLLKQRKLGPSFSKGKSGEEELLRQLKLRLECRVCETRDKDKVIVRCGHALCTHCADKNIQTRLRKCPTCGEKFGDKDVVPLYL